MTALSAEDLYANIQRLFIETVDNGATWSSNLWTVAEVQNYLTQRVYRFLKDTGILYTRYVFSDAGGSRQNLAEDTILIQRVAYDNTSTIKQIPRADGLQADLLYPTWPGVTTTPKMYTDGETPTITIQFMPGSAGIGSFDILYVGYERIRLRARFRIDEFAQNADRNIQAQDRTRFTSVGFDITAGYRLGLPSEFMPYIQYGIMADMLRQVGRPEDMERADYAEQRFMEGIEVAKLILKGWA